MESEPWIDDSKISVAALLETPQGREQLASERAIIVQSFAQRRAKTAKQRAQLLDYRARGRGLRKARQLRDKLNKLAMAA